MAKSTPNDPQKSKVEVSFQERKKTFLKIVFEPSWAILDAPTRRRAPRPGPGEGVGGGEIPPQELGIRD